MSNAHGGCGGATCGCGQAAATATVARVNGVALHAPGEHLEQGELHERAWTELLRQEAVRRGLLPPASSPALDDAAQQVIQAMVDAAVPMPVATLAESRRYYEGHRSRFVQGGRVRLRHILFAVTDGVDVAALAARAEQVLHELARSDAPPERFAELARELSNCPSGADGGELGWVAAHDLAPELAHELFHQAGAAQLAGLRPRLVHSRFGFHVMDVQERDPGREQAFDEVQGAIALALAQQARARALHQYIRVLAGRADLDGLDLDAADSPLVQ